MYGVYCDRADCWSDCELYSCKTAVNIIERGENIEEKKSVNDKYRRDASLIIDIVVYTEHCNTTDSCTALSVLGDIERRLCFCEADLSIRRIIPQGFATDRSQLAETNLTVVTSSYRLEYIADMCNPGAIYKNGSKKRGF